ncbi:MAG TPA: LapA family protein [Gammaproteobacteria bacterium]|nr:LapA family protein [Gammaproteobacteria bacterium]
MGRLLAFVFVIVLVVVGLSFAMLNSQPVTLNYYFGTRDIPLSLIVVVAVAIGAVIGMLASLGSVIRLKQQAGRLRRQLRTARKDADQVRLLP